MRIYLAGLTTLGYDRDSSSLHHVNEEIRAAYPYDLESYHYIKDKDISEYCRRINRKVFLDSGAFTMFTKNVPVDLAAYAQFVKDNADWIEVASNLDAIGKPELETYKNQKALEAMGVSICPVHHARDADKWLQKYIAEGYDYIFLGGMVPESTPYLYQWLDHLWDKYLTRKDGSAKIKIHGFGLTTMELIRRYPWYSVDSTTWIFVGAYGGIWIDLPGCEPMKIPVSSSSPTKHDMDRHLNTYPPALRAHVLDRIAELGYKLEDLAESVGWRTHFNVAFFNRQLHRSDPVFVRREQTLFY